jgi:hypothetical protein
MPYVPHLKSRKHDDARRLVDFLKAEGGDTTLSNPGICKILGMDGKRMYRAKAHLHRCTSLNGFLTAYRMDAGGNNVLALIDPNAIETLSSLSDRRLAAQRGWNGRLLQNMTERERARDHFDGLAQESLSRGNPSGAKALGLAASEIYLNGVISAGTLLAMDLAGV